MLRADGQTDGVRADALIEQLLRRELGVRCRGRVDTRLLTSATLASREKICRWSMKRCASASPPAISKVNMEPPPFGKYL